MHSCGGYRNIVFIVLAMASTILGTLRAVLKLGRWLPVIFVNLVCVWVLYAYNVIFTFGIVQSPVDRVLLAIAFNVLYVLFLWSYFATIFTSLRQVPSSFAIPKEAVTQLRTCTSAVGVDEVLRELVHDKRLPIRTYDVNQHIRYCAKCDLIKPDRACHCSFCDQCILKYDHHCIWVNTCVNFHNYKFFILFIFYGFTLCLFGVATLLSTFIGIWRHSTHGGDLQILFLFFVAGMFGLSLACLLFFHIYLVAFNQSTIESVRPPVVESGPNKTAFHLGICSNFKQVFGNSLWKWPFPIKSSLGDGIVFPIHKRSSRNYPLLVSEQHTQLINDSNEELMSSDEEVNSTADLV